MSNPQKLAFPIVIDDHRADTFAGFFYPATARRRNTLQILIHGVSYDHRYWDAGTVNGNDYSYANYMVGQGFDLLALDLPGVGASSKPNGFSITLPGVARAISELVEASRTDAIPGHTFDRVALVGHSMGANIAVYAEANWPAADTLVVTATGYCPERPGLAWEPGVREELLKDPYASLPRERRMKFYHPPEADPDMIAFDGDELQCPVPTGLWTDCIHAVDGPDSGVSDVSCLTYVQLGEYDPVLPARCAEAERKCYKAAELIIEPISDIGHCFNLHRNRETSWRAISAYLDR